MKEQPATAKELTLDLQSSLHGRSALHTGFARSRCLPAVIQEVTGPVSYLGEIRNGGLVRRHQDHFGCQVVVKIHRIVRRSG